MATTFVDRRHFKGTLAGLQAFESSRLRLGSIEEQVAEEFDECQHGRDCRLLTCGSTKNNPLHSTMTDDELAKPGDEGALLGNLIGFKDGVSVTEHPNYSGTKKGFRSAVRF